MNFKDIPSLALGVALLFGAIQGLVAKPKSEARAQAQLRIENQMVLVDVDLTPSGWTDSPPPTDHKGVKIILRALDLDNAETGWAGVAPSLSEARTRIRFAPGVEASNLPLGEPLQADFTTIYKWDKQGRKVIKEYFVRAVRLEESQEEPD